METIKVILWGREVGRLMWDSRKRNSYFTLNPDFRKTGLNIAPLLMPINSPRADLPIYGQEGTLYQSLPPFIADHYLMHGVTNSLTYGEYRIS